MDDNNSRDWTGLYQIGAFSALIIVLIYLVELLVVVFYGLPPSTAADWFALLQKNRLIGLIQSFALDLIAVTLHAPLYLALYVIFRQYRKGSATLVLAVVLAFIGIAVYLASNITFSMLYLSDQFAFATTGASRAQILASGEAVVAVYNGTGPFVAYFLYAVAGILVSIVMLSSHLFARAVAIAGIVGNALELGLPPSIDPEFFLKIDPILIAIGGVILLFWYVAIALKFYRVSLLKSA